jgi:hypothetical protein
MTEIASTVNGLVTIGTGTTCSAQAKPSQNKDIPAEYLVNIVPGKTTAKELQAQLSLLGIKDINIADLDGIAGANKMFDSNEIGTLDAYLDKKAACFALSRAGIKVDELTVESLDRERARDTDYLKTLVGLQNSGIQVDGSLIEELTLNESRDKDYINVLIELQKSGIKVDGKLMIFLPPKKSRDKAYLGVLIKLQQMGVKIDGGAIYKLTPEKSRDKAYLGALIKLQQMGIKVDGGVIRELLPVNSLDDAYLGTLVKLQQNGIKVDEKIIASLTLEKSRDKSYLGTLIELQESGIGVDGGAIYKLTPEKSRDKPYLGTLIELQKSGIKVDGGIISGLSLGKSRDRAYIETLVKLQQGKIKVDGYLVEFLTLEKTRDQAYLGALIELQKNGIKVDGGIISGLSLEKSRDRPYIETLVKLQQGKIGVDGYLVEFLTLEKTRDQAYLEIIKGCQGDLNAANKQYIKGKIGKDIFETRNFSNASALYKANRGDPVSEQIIYDYLKELALPFVEKINELHETTNAKRLAVVNGFPAGALYLLLVCGREEAYTSTFNLLFGQLMKEMKKEGLAADDLIKQNDPNFKSYRQFLTACSTYGRLDEFLATIPGHERKAGLLSRFVTGLSTSKNQLEDAVIIAELMVYEKNRDILAPLEKYLIEAQRASKEPPETAKLYAVIASSYYTEKGQTVTKDLGPAFQKLAFAHPMRRQKTMRQKELLNASNEIISQQFFYDDKDGKDSFNSMINSYRWDASWQISDQGDYAVISKKGRKATMIIYANKPEHEEAIDVVTKLLPNHATLPSHRGHSYHAGLTIEQLTDNSHLVYLGSCGGFHNTELVLKKVPEAQIIATKGRGTMLVNNPLMKLINETALTGDIDWKKLWAKAAKLIPASAKKDFSFYVPPHRNLAVQIIKAFKQEP